MATEGVIHNHAGLQSEERLSLNKMTAKNLGKNLTHP